MFNPLAGPTDSGLSAPADFHQFTVKSALEISQILHAIMRGAGLITAAVEGDEFFLTSIIAIEDEAGDFILECDRNNKHTERMLRKQRLLCNTTLDKIKIQFVCENVTIIDYDGGKAIRASLPHDLLRLQRREYYRMSTSVTAPVKCSLSVTKSGMRATIEVNSIDISCGGLAVITPPELFTPELGAFYECAIHLPGAAALRARLQARNAFMVKLANGKTAQRSGFAFVDLRESMLASIQRYIMNLERQRKLKQNGE